MGPLVTHALELMDQYGLRMDPDDLFGFELGQLGRLVRGIPKVKLGFGASMIEAAAEKIDPNYEEKVRSLREGIPKGKPSNNKARVTAEAARAKAKARPGMKQAAVFAVADKYGYARQVVSKWVRDAARAAAV